MSNTNLIPQTLQDIYLAVLVGGKKIKFKAGGTQIWEVEKKWFEFKSLDEIKEFMLLRKLSGI